MEKYLLKSYKNYTQNFSKIFIKRKRLYQYKLPAKPLHNSKKSHRVIKNQVQSPSGWHKRQCADFNNTVKVLIHEARYKFSVPIS